MKKFPLTAVILTALVATAPAFATDSSQPPQPTTVNVGGGGGGGGGGGEGGSASATGGSAYGGHGSAEAAAKAWQSMNSAQRAELSSSLTSEQRQALMSAINVANETKQVVKNDNASAGGSSTVTTTVGGGTGGTSNSSSSLTGNNTTTTIGGTTYSYSQPVAGAYVQLPPGIIPSGQVIVTTTACGPDFDVVEARKIQATTNVAMGLFTSTRDNGVVAKTSPQATGLAYGEWTVSGREGDRIIEERTVNGYQAIIYAYLAGSTASSGLNLNGQNGAGAIAGSGGIQTFGKEIDKLPCSFKEVRKLTPVVTAPVKVPTAGEIADEVASRVSVKQTLSAPTVTKKWVPCPKEGCKAPTKGYWTYESKQGEVEASTSVTSKASSAAPKK